MQPVRVVVVGGGVAGLTAAYTLRKALPRAASITVLEAAPAVGGWLSTTRDPATGILFENGCRGLRPVGPSARVALDLIEELGLQRQAVVASSSAQRRYVVGPDGALVQLPVKASDAFTCPATKAAPKWVAHDLFFARPSKSRNGAFEWGATPVPLPTLHDETVGSFMRRRFGGKQGAEGWGGADLLMDAMLSGIFAGDIEALSARSTVLRPVFAAERRAGGVIEGLLKGRKSAGSAWTRPPVSVTAPLTDAAPLTNAAALEGWWEQPLPLGPDGVPCTLPTSAKEGPPSPFQAACGKAASVSFVDGMATLPKRLVEAMGASAPSFETWAAATRARDEEAGQPGVAVVTGAAAVSLAAVSQDALAAHPLSLTVAASSSNAASSSPSATLLADLVVLALPAPRMAALLDPAAASTASTEEAKARVRAAALLRAIPSADVAVVCLGYKSGEQAPPLPSPPGAGGFGFLVPGPFRRRDTGTDGVLGMIWDSQVFPAQADAFSASAALSSPSPAPLTAEDVPSSIAASETRLTVMLGGATAPQVANWGKDAWIAAAKALAVRHLGPAAASPSVVVANLARGAIPQYTVGHDARVVETSALVHRAFGGRVCLAGNSLFGVGASDATASGWVLGQSIAAWVKKARPELV